MAPTFYHYLPVPMDEKRQEQRCSFPRQWLLVAGALMFLIMTSLIILLICFAVRANSKACRDGLQAQDECRNTTRFLQHQLTRTQDSLLQVEIQANTCNSTVVTLGDSLEKKVSQILEQQAHIQKLEREVRKLKQDLDKLRTLEKDSRTPQKNSANSVVVSSLLMLTGQLFLLL